MLSIFDTMQNELSKENSPYLLQHASNPVHWQAWNEKTLALAERENKPMLISVGYASCHWCHVMEKESFEDPEVAALMNTHFINVKIDREERPDLDQLYMNAVQILTGRGGWPMHVVTLPDGRPFWGGTYFKKHDWMALLEQLAEAYNNESTRVESYAEKLSEGIRTMDLVSPPSPGAQPEHSEIRKGVEQWTPYLDPDHGGRKGAPKFPIPVNLEFLLKYAHLNEDKTLEAHVLTTLDHMNYGGIKDQLGGGFARYSTDPYWRIPHFEMMLYDNAQLLSLYANAYRKFRQPAYLKTTKETAQFLQNTLKNNYGLFICGLDADSPDATGQSVEGAYYTWTTDQLRTILKEKYEPFASFYRIEESQVWENNRYVLQQTHDPEEVARAHSLSINTLNTLIAECKELLLNARSQRTPPTADDKCLTSWNAMTVSGFTDAYKATGDQKFLDTAIETHRAIQRLLSDPDGGLYHSFRNGKAGIEGFLEDYAFTIKALIDLFGCGAGDELLKEARNLCNYTLDRFFDDRAGMFRFSLPEHRLPVSNPIETTDSVIASANAVMAQNLFKLGKLYGNASYENIARQMYLRQQPQVASHAYSHAQWASLGLDLTSPFYEIVISGPDTKKHTKDLLSSYLPGTLVVPISTAENIPIMQNRMSLHKNRFYVCSDRVCKTPVGDLNACLEQIS